MNVKEFVTENFKKELLKYGIQLKPSEIALLQENFDFDAIKQTINKNLEFNTKLGRVRRSQKLYRHKRILKTLTKSYAFIVYTNYIKTRLITESLAQESQAKLKCNCDIYPCEKKGFESGN